MELNPMQMLDVARCCSMLPNVASSCIHGIINNNLNNNNNDNPEMREPPKSILPEQHKATKGTIVVGQLDHDLLTPRDYKSIADAATTKNHSTCYN